MARIFAALIVLVLVTACHSAGQPTGPASGGPLVTGRGWSGNQLDGPVPAPSSCHYRYDGREPLPDPNCSPGSVDSAVQQGNLGSTVCRRGGYTGSVRPPEALTNAAKTKLLAAYGIPASKRSSYELDHIVELAAGGSSDLRNLWPEPNQFVTASQSAFIHNDKDAVEAYLFHALCAGKVKLAALQRAISSDWTTAVAVLGLPPIPRSYAG